MPIQGDNYVAPEWKNGQPPAINAQELNDISNTLANDWRRNEVLTSNTARVFGLQNEATPDQVFAVIANQFSRTVTVTVTLDGTPIQGVTVYGIQQEDGSPCVTSEAGITIGIAATSQTTISTNVNWVDVQNVQKTIDTSQVSTSATLELLSQSSGKLEITSSKSVTFSPKRTTIQYCVIGGGASGPCVTVHSTEAGVCGGSGSGEVVIGNLTNNNSQITIIVGSGGAGHTISSAGTVSAGRSGGQTSLSYSSEIITADGGQSGGTQIGPYDYVVARGCNGGNGGNGGGAAFANGKTGQYLVGNSGTNGSNGGDASGYSGGTGQGTTTTFDGVSYSKACGGCCINGNNYAGKAADNSKYGTTIKTGNAPDVAYGSSSGSVATTSTNITIQPGRQGAVILKWTI